MPNTFLQGGAKNVPGGIGP